VEYTVTIAANPRTNGPIAWNKLAKGYGHYENLIVYRLHNLVMEICNFEKAIPARSRIGKSL
jgi:hypothetical protein